MLCNFLDLMVNNGLNILNLFFEIFKSEYKYSLTINKVEDIENKLSNIKNSFPFSDLPKTIAKQISDFVFLDDIPDYPNPIYPLKKEIIKILKNHNLLDTNNLLEYIPTLYGNYIMSYKILDCKDIFKFIITNLLSDNHNQHFQLSVLMVYLSYF